MFALVLTPVAVDGKKTVALAEGQTFTYSIGTCRTISGGDEAYAIRPEQRKPKFQLDVPASEKTDVRPPYVLDNHKNCGDPQEPGVGGLLYCAGFTCAANPLLVLSQHTMKQDLSIIKVLTLVLGEDLTCGELDDKNRLVRESSDIPSQFDHYSVLPVEWNYGWGMLNQSQVGETPSAALTRCHCYSNKQNHGRYPM